MKAALAIVALALAAIGVGRAAEAQSAFTKQQLAALSFHQHPGALLPLDAKLTDEAGRSVRLADYFQGRPVVLVLEYLRCRTLCGFVLSGLARTLSHVPLTAGKDYSVVAVSIDPRDTPADARAARGKYRAEFGADAGWHFLTGTESEVRRIADTVGFPYRYDKDAGQYAHPAGVTVVAPDGKIARYILGIDYKPLDMRLALVEAGKGTISSPVTDLLLLCYCYDPQTGRYDATIGNIMRVAGGLTVAGIAGMVVMLNRQRRMSPR